MSGKVTGPAGSESVSSQVCGTRPVVESGLGVTGFSHRSGLRLTGRVTLGALTVPAWDGDSHASLQGPRRGNFWKLDACLLWEGLLGIPRGTGGRRGSGNPQVAAGSPQGTGLSGTWGLMGTWAPVRQAVRRGF